MTSKLPPQSDVIHFTPPYYTLENQKVYQVPLCADKPKAPKRTREDSNNLAGRVKPCLEKNPLWRCFACHVTGDQTPRLRLGPTGRNTLCNACGLKWAKYGDAGIKIAQAALGVSSNETSSDEMLTLGVSSNGITSDALPPFGVPSKPVLMTPKMRWKFENK